MSKDKPVDIPALTAAQEQLFQAVQKYDKAKQDAEFARRRETEAINDLNAAQKTVDTLYTALKAAAPRCSDWGSRP
jgi:hypothetical protein